MSLLCFYMRRPPRVTRPHSLSPYTPLFRSLLLTGAHPVPLLVAACLFGGAAFSVYPIAVAHLIDHLHAEQILAGNAALLLVHGAGAALGDRKSTRLNSSH